MNDLHPLLKRQLKNAFINLDNNDISENVRTLLIHVNNAYHEADKSRYIIERSMEISSQEMQQLRDVIQKEKDIIQAVISDGFCILDPLWRITSLNKTGLDLLFCSQKNVIGKHFFEIFTLFDENKDNLEINTDILQIKCKKNQVYHSEKGRLETFNGLSHPVSFSINPLPLLKNNTFGGAVLIFRDITERLQTENLLQTSLKAAEQSNKAKAQFLANMTHEIRTPMNGVLGMLQLLMHTKLDDTQKHYAEKCFECGNSLLRILGDILDFSKIEEGKVDFENEEFNLREEFESLLTIFTTQCLTKHIIFTVSIDDNVPAVVKGDVFRIKQILNNLVSNAIKFTPVQGKINIHVELITLIKDNIELKISVKDTGIGIKRELQNKIFEAFSQADESTTREYGGTGLGLAICKHLVNLMGGEINLNSELGQGSEFYFTINLEKGKKEAKKNINGILPTIPQFQAEVLVVEDNPTNQVVISEMLESLGCKTQIVNSGKDALNVLENNDYDLIFMDCHMPDMDGFKTTIEIREKERKLELKNKVRLPLIL